MKTLHRENVEEHSEDEQAWGDWLVESDSCPSSDDSNWINVDSDAAGNLEISDSGDEVIRGEVGSPESYQQSSGRVSSLATTKVGNLSRVPCEGLLTPLRYLRQRILL